MAEVGNKQLEQPSLVLPDQRLRWRPLWLDRFIRLTRTCLPTNVLAAVAEIRPEEVMEEVVHPLLTIPVTADAEEVRYKCLRICCIRSGMVEPISPARQRSNCS